MKKIIVIFSFFLFSTTIAISKEKQSGENMPDKIVWNEISKDEGASMPFGNGVVAGNIWTEKDGVRIYLARNDSWSELGRLMKIGRLHLDIDSLKWDNNFSQTLDLASGSIKIENPDVTLTIFADSDFPVIWIHGVMKNASKVIITPEIWREKPVNPRYVANGCESIWSAVGFLSAPFLESADVIVKGGFYHHNDTSVIQMTAINNHLNPDMVPEQIKNRTFGALMSSTELSCDEKGGSISTEKPIKEFVVKVAVISTQGNWNKESNKVLSDVENYNKAYSRTKTYWEKLWDKSYIKVSTPDIVTGKKITESYNCQRWMTTIAGKSDYPIKFSGSLFTVKEMEPDCRRWGECYWWQNTRLPYYPMLKTGDWDVLTQFFKFFNSLIPVFKENARSYHNSDGATFPETMTPYGTFAVKDFGYGQRYPQSMWIRHIMQGPLDLVHLMMDYYRYSNDKKFMYEVAFPMSEEFLEFFISRNQLDQSGKLRIKNTQALETYWFDVENDAPEIAGLHSVVKDFRSIEGEISIPKSLADKIDYLENVVPAIPVQKDSTGSEYFLPAEVFKDTTTNCENPELMSIFPFRLSTIVNNKEIGINSFMKRKNKFDYGWPSDGQVAAILGLTDIAKEQLIARIANTNPKYKFISYYGPNFDWTPDQCHGGNIMTILQEMVMQCYDNKVYLLPAFPKEWNVCFRLAVPGNTFVKGKYNGGKWLSEPKVEKQIDLSIVKIN